MAALAVGILLLGGIIPVGTFAAPIFAGICFLPIAIELGAKWALLCFFAAAFLGGMLVPDQELMLFFIFLLGYYPMLQPTLEKIKPKALCALIKQLLFNLAVAAVYALLYFLFANPGLQAELAENSLWFWALLLGLANITFVLYDMLLHKVRLIYNIYFHKHFKC